MNYFESGNVDPAVEGYIIQILDIVKERPVVTRTVEELLWGYTDDALAQLFPSPTVSIFNASVILCVVNVQLNLSTPEK